MKLPGIGFRTSCLMDPPVVLNAANNAIPSNGSSPYQIVASLPDQIVKLKCTNTTGKQIGLYVGPPGLEVFETLVDGDQDVMIPPGSRVSLRNMESGAIVKGYITIQFKTLFGVA